MNTTDRPPFNVREYMAEKQNKSARDTQRELDFMRAMYAERRNANCRRHEAMVGWSLVAVAIGFPVLVAIAYLI